MISVFVICLSGHHTSFPVILLLRLGYRRWMNPVFHLIVLHCNDGEMSNPLPQSPVWYETDDRFLSGLYTLAEQGKLMLGGGGNLLCRQCTVANIIQLHTFGFDAFDLIQTFHLLCFSFYLLLVFQRNVGL